MSPSVSRRGVLAGALGAAAHAIPRSRQASAQDAPEAQPTIQVFPRPNSTTGYPGTQISFHGEGVARLSPIKVSGAVSGEHSGIEVRHSDGNGVSFYPDVAFQPSETVVVDTRLGIVGGESGAFQFACCTPRFIETNPVDNPADGAVVFEWHSLDHIPIAETYLQHDPEFPNRFIDYVHANALALDAEGNLVVTARNSWAAYKVDRVTGDVLWRYGGKASSFEMGEGTELAWPHDARPTEDGGLRIFDNGAAPPVHEESRGLLVALDTDAMTATLTKAYTHPESVLADSQGNIQALPNGNVLIGWGGVPLASEFAADGTLVLDIRLPEDKESYRAFRFEWDGQPNDQPVLAIEPSADGIAAFATWNGATAVAGWRALAGEKEDNLALASDVVPRGGFETEISVTAAGRLVAVEALNAAGEPIGRSRAVARDE